MNKNELLNNIIMMINDVITNETMKLTDQISVLAAEIEDREIVNIDDILARLREILENRP